MATCKAKSSGEEFDVEIYQGQPDRVVECHHCGAEHLIGWVELAPGAARLIQCKLLGGRSDQAAVVDSGE